MRTSIDDAIARGAPILVTGAAGFIGFHVAERLLTTGATVIGFDNLNDYYDVSLKRARLSLLCTKPGFSFEQGDVGDHERIARLVSRLRPSLVIHLAAQAGVRYSLSNPRAYTSTNVDGFLSVLEAVRTTPVQHLIYASSSSVYGRNSKVPFHEDDPVTQPSSLYAATKRANELMAEVYAHLYAMPCSGLRFFTVYGPWGRPDMAYFKFTDAILRGQPIDVYNHGRLRRDFTYIDDVVEAIVRLANRPPASFKAASGRNHAIYNVGNHTPVDLGNFIATLENVLGIEAKKNDLPMQQGDVLETFADVGRLSQAVNFAPNTPLATGLTRFVQWYREYHRV